MVTKAAVQLYMFKPNSDAETQNKYNHLYNQPTFTTKTGDVSEWYVIIFKSKTGFVKKYINTGFILFFCFINEAPNQVPNLKPFKPTLTVIQWLNIDLQKYLYSLDNY